MEILTGGGNSLDPQIVHKPVRSLRCRYIRGDLGDVPSTTGTNLWSTPSGSGNMPSICACSALRSRLSAQKFAPIRTWEWLISADALQDVALGLHAKRLEIDRRGQAWIDDTPGEGFEGFDCLRGFK